MDNRRIKAFVMLEYQSDKEADEDLVFLNKRARQRSALCVEYFMSKHLNSNLLDDTVRSSTTRLSVDAAAMDLSVG